MRFNKIIQPYLHEEGGYIYKIDFSSDKYSLGGSALYQSQNKVGKNAPDIKDSKYFKLAFNTIQKCIKENTIYNEDCLKYMERLKEQNIKVDCIVLDPPYFNVVNEKWDKEWKSLEEYLNRIENIFEKCNAVSKYNCNLCCVYVFVIVVLYIYIYIYILSIYIYYIYTYIFDN